MVAGVAGVAGWITGTLGVGCSGAGVLVYIGTVVVWV